MAIAGNGSWLRNEGYRFLAALPELRAIRIDHNGPAAKSNVPRELYDGSGIAALEHSKLQEFKMGHSFNDNGMRALAKIKSLRVITVTHSKVTDEGVAALAAHPNIEEVNFSPMGRPLITNKTLKTLSTLPKLKRISMNETFVTYADGFEHLAPLKGRLESVILKGSLVLPADIEKLKADHPGIAVTTSAPKDIVKGRQQLMKWASPEAVEYLKAGE